MQAAGGVDLQARYRHDGLRDETVAGGTTTRFVYDGVNYLLETSAAGVVQVAYTVEPQPYGEVLARRASAASRFYHLDVCWARCGC